MKILRMTEFTESNSNGVQVVEFIQDVAEIDIRFSGKQDDVTLQADITLDNSDIKELIEFLQEVSK